MYQLYYYPLNASLAPHFVLQDVQLKLGVDYELVLVDRKSDAQKSADYLALNPAGRIPTLVEGDAVVFESAAICMHLCEQNPQANLMPEIGHPDRPLCHQWLMYLTNTLQAELMIYFYPQRYASNKEVCADIVTGQQTRIADCLQLLDDALAGKDYLVGNSVGVCDYFLLMLAIWADEIEKPPLSFAHLKRYLCQLVKHDAVQTVCKKENIGLDEYE